MGNHRTSKSRYDPLALTGLGASPRFARVPPGLVGPEVLANFPMFNLTRKIIGLPLLNRSRRQARAFLDQCRDAGKVQR